MEKRKKIDIAPIVDLGSNSYFWLFEYENNKLEIRLVVNPRKKNEFL